MILGGNGFIGRAIKSRLEFQGVSVVSPNSETLNLLHPNSAEFLSEIVKPADTVVMLAAITPDKGRDISSQLRNLKMMESVCVALQRSVCAHFVYVSSDAVYDQGVSLVREATVASPTDLYGAMHLTREVMARSLSPIPLLILRPSIVYGTEDPHNSYGPNRFRRMVKQAGKITLFGLGEEYRDHIHVDDVATLIVGCIFRKTVGILNLATGTSYSFAEVANIIVNKFDKGVKVEFASRSVPITHRHYDVTNLLKAFPNFSFLSLEEGIDQLFSEK